MIENSRGCVLFATLEFYPTKANAGGAGIFVHHTARLLLEQGFTVVVLFDGTRAEYEQLVNVDRLAIPFGHRMTVYSVDDLCQDQVLQPGVCGDINIVKSLRLDHALRKLVEIHNIDLIELYDYCGHGS